MRSLLRRAAIRRVEVTILHGVCIYICIHTHILLYIYLSIYLFVYLFIYVHTHAVRVLRILPRPRMGGPAGFNKHEQLC